MNELRNRGTEDVLLAVVDGLKGFPSAAMAAFKAIWDVPCRPDVGALGATHLRTAKQAEDVREAYDHSNRPACFEGEVIVIRWSRC